jgi:hypothetical protein
LSVIASIEAGSVCAPAYFGISDRRGQWHPACGFPARMLSFGSQTALNPGEP